MESIKGEDNQIDIDFARMQRIRKGWKEDPRECTECGGTDHLIFENFYWICEDCKLAIESNESFDFKTLESELKKRNITI
jgi:ribosomal protein L37AE/L43A